MHSHENAPQPKLSSVLPLRSKVKTRGATSNPSGLSDRGNANTTEEDGSLSAEDTAQPRFVVKARAYKVFSTLFYTPTPHGQPGDVNWTDFLHDMNAIGFLPVKLHGSAWSFSPGRDNDNIWQQTINFHEPHPSSNLAFVVARRYGRRLTRNYGLTGDSFVFED